MTREGDRLAFQMPPLVSDASNTRAFLVAFPAAMRIVSVTHPPDEILEEGDRKIYAWVRPLFKNETFPLQLVLK